LVDLSSNAINLDQDEVKKESNSDAHINDNYKLYAPIFETVAETLRDLPSKNANDDSENSDSFSSDSDDEETNLMNTRINRINLPKEGEVNFKI
jgi:hypothetical protein